MDPLGWLRKAPKPHCGLSAVTPNTRGRTGDNKKANYRARRAGAGQRDEYGALRAGSAYACRSRRRCYQRLIVADQNQAVGARPVRHTHQPEAETCAAACAWTQPASSTQTHSICAARLWIVDESSAAPNGGSVRGYQESLRCVTVTVTQPGGQRADRMFQPVAQTRMCLASRDGAF